MAFFAGICYVSVSAADSPSSQSYRSLLSEIEEHARSSLEKGIASEQAAKEFKLTESLGDYRYFRSGFHEMAMEAWYREISK